MLTIRLRAIFIIVLVGCSSASLSRAQGSRDPKVIDGAKKEREAVWYTTTNLETSKVVVDQFQKKYPFINVILYRTTVGPLINRILVEARAGKYDWDLLSGGGELFTPVMERGLIAPYRSPEAKMIDDDLMDKQGYWTAYTVASFVLAYNKQQVRPQEVPKTYDALLDGRWKGQKIGMETSAGVMHALIPVWGREKTLGYFRQLAAQNPVLKDSGSTIVQLVIAGEMPIGIGLAHLFELFSRKGAPIEWLPLEPTVVRVIPMMLAAKPRHPNAAKLLYDFLLSSEGQQIIRSYNRPTVRRDVLPEPPRLIQGYKRVTMYPELYRNLDDTQRVFNEMFGVR
jgi:iron(III) transport system substrate-binding protein